MSALHRDVGRYIRISLVALVSVIVGLCVPVGTRAEPETPKRFFNGKYSAAQPQLCDDESHSHGSFYPSEPGLLHVNVSPQWVELHVAPPGFTRIIEMEPTGHPSRGITHYQYAGMGKWEENTLVVETKGPATPLWYVDAPVSALLETFSFQGHTLTYEAWSSLRKTPRGRPLVSVALSRCD